MKERPIIFSTPMVKAILDRTKTQTRRVIKQQPQVVCDGDAAWRDAKADLWRNVRQYRRDCCPYDGRLWVREACSIVYDGEYLDVPRLPQTTMVAYRADHPDPASVRWRPSIHMPRWASRITLEITDVRVQRVREISDTDCEAEGVRPSVDGTGKDWRDDENGWHRTYRQLWDSINAKRGFGWDTNPWVWVVGFKHLDVATVPLSAMPSRDVPSDVPQDKSGGS